MNKLHQRNMKLCVRAKVDFGPNGQVVKYSAVRAAEYSFKNHNDSLLNMLTAY